MQRALGGTFLDCIEFFEKSRNILAGPHRNLHRGSLLCAEDLGNFFDKFWACVRNHKTSSHDRFIELASVPATISTTGYRITPERRQRIFCEKIHEEKLVRFDA
jgi:hypothetical protein